MPLLFAQYRDVSSSASKISTNIFPLLFGYILTLHLNYSVFSKSEFGDRLRKFNPLLLLMQLQGPAFLT
jgi:hypothetical protein